jgi:uncharacterized protein (AIM24 family)
VGSGGLVQGVLSVISGEEFFRLIYHNASNHIGYVGLTPNLPGTVIPVNMQLHPNVCLRATDPCRCSPPLFAGTALQTWGVFWKSEYGYQN